MNSVACSAAQAVLEMERFLQKNNLLQPSKRWENTHIKHQLDRRNAGEPFSVSDHIRAMVYAMLSSGIAWERVESGVDPATGRITPIDEIFCQYDPEELMRCDPAALRDQVKHKAASLRQPIDPETNDGPGNGKYSEAVCSGSAIRQC